MDSKKNFGCVIIGSGTLPVRCAELLLDKNHSIRAFVSTDRAVKNWAKERNIHCLEPGANLSDELSRYSFEYLFSIVNEYILPPAVLRSARKMAINYHDAPLPLYAGTHATSWALLNGEKTHGISWHLIAEKVDAGDILARETIEIDENETALTLNTKCYEAAINSFARLIDELAGETAEPRPQNLAERTFFARFKKPPNAGVISWKSPAAEISRLVRALDFGAHPNALGTAKLFVSDNFFIVRKIEILDSASKSARGTITKIGGDFLQIAAADREILISQIQKLDGSPAPVAEIVKEFGLSENFRLPEPGAEILRRLETLYNETAKEEKFWAARLENLEPAVIPFAGGAALPAGAAEPERLPVKIPAEVKHFLDARTDLKPDDFLLAAFIVLLARLNRAARFDVGYQNSALQKKIAGAEKLFASELPLCIETNFRQQFTDFLSDCRTRIEALEKRQTFALDISARYPPLTKVSEFDLPVVLEKTARIDETRLAARTQLKFAVSGTTPDALLIYDRTRISEADARRLIVHLETLLRGIAADPQAGIAFLPLLSAAEREKLLFECNDNALDFPHDKAIHHLFEAQAQLSPEATALIFGDTRLNYAELNRRANRLAHYLQKLGVRPETMIGVCVERSIEMIVGILAILKAGGAYVPLDPNYPPERIELMLEDSNASIVLANEKTAANLKNHRARIVRLDRDWEIIETEPDKNPVSDVSPENLAYVIYTSGSTGKPKGVAIEHRNTIAFLCWALSVFSPEQLEGVLASTSVCFDLSVFEMFAPLSCGGAVVLVENVLYLPDAPARDEVTLINSVPSAITELLRIGGVPASAKTVNLAGEPLKPSLVRQIYALGTVEMVYDLYGPSEDTTYSTFTLRDEGAATIGRPIANTQAYILDDFLQPVPAGIPGELYLGGAGLARGYLNRPELTAEKFVKNPFGADDSARMYKTGDLARFLPTGKIEYLGRIDNQVKIRGFRVELGEIEARLAAHAAIREAIAAAREDEPGEKRLVAYIVRKPNRPLKFAELREFLKQQLPDYMIPSAFVELDELPLTPNGKIDRKALPAPAANQFDEERILVSHRDPLEEKLVRIWENILNVGPVGVEDDFFELGGHSLQAVRMFAEVEKTFNKNIPLATLFQAGTIARLAEILRADGWAAPESSLVPIQPEGTKPIFFCVHAKGGNVLFYRDLARRLGADQPFYGIQARRLGGRQVGHSNLREMAEFYIREIQTVQPEGPYFLGGSSFGGLAAFEMAQQLSALGHEVALLALLDTGTPDYPRFPPGTNDYRRKFYGLVRRFQQQRDNLKALSSKEKLDYVFEKLKKVRLKYRRRIRDNYKKAARKIYRFFNGKAPLPQSYIQLEDQIWRAGQNYVPKVYPGKVTLFRATLQPLGIVPDDTLGWREFVGGELEIHEVPGHHGSIVAEPYVAVLAEKLKICLETARAGNARLKERPSREKAERRAAARV